MSAFGFGKQKYVGMAAKEAIIVIAGVQGLYLAGMTGLQYAISPDTRTPLTASPFRDHNIAKEANEAVSSPQDDPSKN